MTKLDVDLLVMTQMREYVLEQLEARFRAHKLYEASDPDEMLARIAPNIRAIATGAHKYVDVALMEKLPNLEIVSNFGVGYDNVDAKSAGTRGIIVTNTPDVLSDEVADTAIGLMISARRKMEVRQLSADSEYVTEKAARHCRPWTHWQGHCRAGRELWPQHCLLRQDKSEHCLSVS